jgi:AraC-like DNA-binding protein
MHMPFPIIGSRPVRGQRQFILRDDFPAFPPAARCLGPLLDGLSVPEASAAWYRCTAAWRIPRRHLRHELIILGIAGRAEIEIDGRGLALAPGRLVAARRRSWLSARADPRQPPELAIIALQAAVPGGASLLDAAGLPLAIDLAAEDGAAALLGEACREDALRPPGWRTAVRSLVQRALIVLVRRHGGAPAARSGQEAGLARLEPALAAMRQDLDQPVRMSELAAACSLSPAQFRRVFRATLGCTPIAHQRDLRMAAARELLAGSELPIATIARQVGYRGEAFFARTFTRLVGTAPGRWRRRSRP